MTTYFNYFDSSNTNSAVSYTNEYDMLADYADDLVDVGFGDDSIDSEIEADIFGSYEQDSFTVSNSEQESVNIDSVVQDDATTSNTPMVVSYFASETDTNLSDVLVIDTDALIDDEVTASHDSNGDSPDELVYNTLLNDNSSDVLFSTDGTSDVYDYALLADVSPADYEVIVDVVI